MRESPELDSGVCVCVCTDISLSVGLLLSLYVLEMSVCVIRAYPHGPVFVCALERASWSRTVSLTLKFG